VKKQSKFKEQQKEQKSERKIDDAEITIIDKPRYFQKLVNKVSRKKEGDNALLSKLNDSLNTRNTLLSIDRNKR